MLAIDSLLRHLKDLKVGAILNPTSVTPELRHMADVLHEAGVLAALFGPEHGVRGDAQYLEAVSEARDARTGVPEHSLYGKDFGSLTPRDEHLKGLDALVFDIQDVGSRYFTYLATMGLSMKAAAKNKLKFFVLDRPNPLGGVAVEGGIVHPGFESFVGLFPVSARHGLTAGEYARFINEEIRCDLFVVELQGWKRDMLWNVTGLPWVLPSPNMPTFSTALVYPGMCLLEGTNLSEGRGTTRPFEIWGAPWLDARKLAASLDAEGFRNVRFRPCSFTPTWDKHKGERCHGVQIHIFGSDIESVKLGVAAIVHARAQDPFKFRWRTEKYEFVENIPAIDLLAGSDAFRKRVDGGARTLELWAMWEGERAEYEKRRQRYLIYG